MSAPTLSQCHANPNQSREWWMERSTASTSVIEDAEISRNDLVFQNRSSRNVDAVAVISDDDHGTFKYDPLAKPDVPRNGQMVQFQNIRNAIESRQVVGNLIELGSKFDEGSGGKHSFGVHDERAGVERVKIGHDEQQIRGLLNRQKTASGNVDAYGAFEVMNRRPDRSLQLYHVEAVL